jgi:predicted nucleotidyltransferase
MPSITRQLTDRRLITPPSWLPDNIQFEGVQGSNAYGVAVDTSDFDVVGWCIPPKDMIFPHLAGEIEGFGRQRKRFVCYQQHHVKDADAQGGRGREYDLNVYNIVHYFQLTMDNNPNMVASLFLPVDCVLHITKIGEMVREKRHIFLHKGAWHRFKGYAYQQLSKMSTKSKELGHGVPSAPGSGATRTSSKRAALVEQFGFDVKFAYHLVRLMYEIEQILTTGDVDLRRNAEELKAIRRGEVPEQKIRDFFAEKEKFLEGLYEKSSLPWGPREPEIRQLLLDCLEEHYGNLSGCVVTEGDPLRALREIAAVVDENRHLLR